MGKKSKKKSTDPKSILEQYAENASKETKKDLYKRYKELLKEIEYEKYHGWELDKLAKKDTRRNINRKEKEFYDHMKSLKKRRKDMKESSRSEGKLDRLVSAVSDLLPVIKTTAKLVMVAILGLLSVETIQRSISPKVLEKLSAVFKIAMAV